MLERLSKDMLAEFEELEALVAALPPEDWERRTGFFDWTIRDQIMHLNQTDAFGLTALRSEEEFRTMVRGIRAAQAEGIEISEQGRRAVAHMTMSELLGVWRTTFLALVERLLASDPKARMVWFGPDMSLVSFASARQMEIWAHGQDIYDLLGVRRIPQDRLRNICEIGVRTFGWSFRNRELDVPPTPRVRLVGPSGATWEWLGDDVGLVAGSARDFALLVTQRRAAQDTGLVTEGEAARQWLAIAQCFAGPPQMGAAPGSRPRA